MDRTVLVNKSNPIPPGHLDSVEIVIVKVDEGFSVPLERETAERYLQMRRYLLSIGIHVEAVSGGDGVWCGDYGGCKEHIPDLPEV